VLTLQLAAGVFKAVSGEAQAAVGEHVCDLEGKRTERLFQEGDRACCQLVVFDS
jgi:hypothetical protein